MAKKILIVEDEGVVALQIKSDLEQMGYSVTDICVTGEQAIGSFEKIRPDLVLMDITLKGQMDGIETAGQINERYDVPVIYLTAHSAGSTIERAKMTAPYGYILKPFNARELSIAVEMALYKHQIDREKERLSQELREALEKVKLLSGMLPICSFCKKIRDDKGYWKQLEAYISEHSEAEFSHCICQDCAKKLYPEYYDKIYRGKEDKTDK